MPQTLDETARARLRGWIAATHVTQTEVAARIGRNQAWLSRYLNGEFDADLETLQALAKVFSHSLASLLDLPSDPDEAKLIELYRALSAGDRELVMKLLERWARPPRNRRRSGR